MRQDGFVAMALHDGAPPGFLEQLAGAMRERGLRCCLAAGRLHIYAGERTPLLILPDGQGAVIGNLFDQAGRVVHAVTAGMAQCWVDTGGSALVETHWGRYVAILRTARGTVVIRDPSGMAPCYHAPIQTGTLLASDADWASASSLFSPRVAWDEILSQLHYFSLRTPRTALRGLEELVPGAALHIEPRGARTELLWTPYPFASAPGRPRSFEEAVEALRPAVLRTVAAWAQLFRHPIAEISGGLDSSIVSASLAAAGAGVSCLSFRGGDADLDEQRHARAVAEGLGFPFHVEALRADAVDLRRSAAAGLPHPNARTFSQSNDRQAMRIAGATGADAFFIGTSGDNIFWYFNTAAPALDRLQVDGLPGFLETIGELAAMCDVRRTTALRIALAKRFQRRPRPWPHSLDLLAGAAHTLSPPPAHPWLPAPRGTLPGVAAYVRALIQTHDHHDYHQRTAVAPVIAPLLSQPIVETCLAMPSWFSCRGGHNRAVARAAFAGLLPAAVLARRDKGAFDGFAHSVLEHHRAVAREMLLGGILAREGLIDIPAIAQLLAAAVPAGGERGNRVLRLVAIEAWLQSLPSGAD